MMGAREGAIQGVTELTGLHKDFCLTVNETYSEIGRTRYTRSEYSKQP